MEEAEEEELLFNTLGVKSANPEDVEHDILKEVEEPGVSYNAIEHTEKLFSDEEPDAKRLSLTATKVSSKLRAVEMEIKVVEESVQLANVTENRSNRGCHEDVRHSGSDLSLQHALAFDRLRSLKEARAQLKKELNELGKDVDVAGDRHEKLLQNHVKGGKKNKISKEVHISITESRKRSKIMKFDDDLDFDATLDAVPIGLLETEKDKLVRKGTLTPFHKIKGFERQLHLPGPSDKNESEDSAESHVSSSIFKAAQSFAVIAQARPTTKLLDAKSSPKLEAPSLPFHRIRTPDRFSRSLERSKERDKHLGKWRRPLPDKKWRKAASDNVMHSVYEEEKEELGKPVDNESCYVTLEGGIKIPEGIFSRLFDYQKTGVQWLWELHCQRAGGILGDEMGLGKTIQILAFLGSLHYSRLYMPSIIICPATLLFQWKREAHKWYPKFHVEILHDSARVSSYGKKLETSEGTDDETDELSDTNGAKTLTEGLAKKWRKVVDSVLRSESGLLITTYEQLRLHGEKLLDVEWGYAVLDEGHRIRNPNAEITLVCKQLQTVHRIIMTGAPIQNKLSELWSLFDFVFPGKLGVLPVFEIEFAVPIAVGGYANATPLQVSTAYRCAVILRDLIMPYLLRRMKSDVEAQLPKKTEHVLFCSLTSEQRAAYRAFLASSEVEQIFDGSRNALYGIDIMRKICNHPDLLEREYLASDPDYGNPERSGKMKVIKQILKVWKDQGHRVLLFAQTQQMLDILENFLNGHGYSYRRMDGLTPVKQRSALIDEFNNSAEIFLFILTTRVGGLGTNLTGADRVIIFDPDWNPSTDIQARERAWRIGQTRTVTVYRLITRGTIEEKVYHRQIYKHFLTNKILKNPQQKRFFKARDLTDLFTLQDEEEGGATETSVIFGQLSENVNVRTMLHKEEIKQSNSTNVDLSPDENVDLSPDSDRGADHKGKINRGGQEDEETEVLKSLFDAYGLHSAINHDIIISANDEEKARVEEQAFQVAQRAAEALRQSQFLRSQDSISVPTWTGRAGVAGAPSSVGGKFGSTLNAKLMNSSRTPDGPNKSGGFCNINGFAAGTSSGKILSSAEILAKIRETQQRATKAGCSHQPGLTSGSTHRALSRRTSRNLKGLPKHMQPEILIRQLCTYMQLQGGATTSALIVRHFKDKIPSDDLPLFKNLLKEIAVLEKDPDGSSRWVLKHQYKQ